MNARARAPRHWYTRNIYHTRINTRARQPLHYFQDIITHTHNNIYKKTLHNNMLNTRSHYAIRLRTYAHIILFTLREY